MSILDDAIREHLELKRAHGADESELKRLEDEAFGPPGRPEEPDPLAEAPTEFLATPETPEAVEPGGEPSGRRINIADLQEPPPEQDEQPEVDPAPSVEPVASPPVPAEDAAQAAPADEEELAVDAEPLAMEHEVVADPSEPSEREAIAEQPTELFDIEAEMGTEDDPAPNPTTEIHASRTEPPAQAPVEEDEEDEEFWSEQRLADELDQALESPLAEVDEIPAPIAEPQAPLPEVDDDGDDEDHRPDFDPDTGHEDVLEDTPDFLEDAPEDDELWFEQKPPKDFDFDD